MWYLDDGHQLMPVCAGNETVMYTYIFTHKHSLDCCTGTTSWSLLGTTKLGIARKIHKVD